MVQTAGGVGTISSTSLHERLPLLRSLGLGLSLAWAYVIFYSAVLFPGAEVYAAHSRLLWMVSLTALTASLVLITRFADRRVPLNSRPVYLIGSPSLAVIGTLLIPFAYQQQVMLPLAIAVLGAFLTGLGAAWFFFAWGEFYGALGMRATSRCIPASLLLVVALYFLVSSLQPLPAVLTTAAFPVASAVMLKLSVLSLPSGTTRLGDLEEHTAWVFPRGLLVSIAAYAAAFGYIRAMSVSESGPEGGVTGYFFFGGIGLAALALGITTFASQRELEPARAYRFAVALGVAGFLMLPFLESRYASVVGVVVGGAWSCFDMVVWIVLADIVSRVRRPAVEVIGWGRAPAHAGMLAGALLGSLVTLLSPERSFIAIAVSLGIAYALVLIGMFSARGVTADNVWGTEDTGQDASAQGVGAGTGQDQSAPSIDERCAVIARRYRLTGREHEVLCMLARGRNVAYIQQTLSLSTATAKTHVHHVYSKLDVHDRQQLLDLIDSVDSVGRK